MSLHEQVASRITVVPAPWTVSADFPARRIVSARRAPHHHAIALEVENGIVSANAAEELSETTHRAADNVGGSAVLRVGFH
jgi:hypothetical protein